MTGDAKPKPKRDGNGHWLAGESGNAGGRPSLPEEFRRRGPVFLGKIAEIAEDAAHKMNFDALRWCAERIYGKAPAEVKDDGEEQQKAALVQFVEMMKKKPKGEG